MQDITIGEFKYKYLTVIEKGFLELNQSRMFVNGDNYIKYREMFSIYTIVIIYKKKITQIILETIINIWDWILSLLQIWMSNKGGCIEMVDGEIYMHLVNTNTFNKVEEIDKNPFDYNSYWNNHIHLILCDQIPIIDFKLKIKKDVTEQLVDSTSSLYKVNLYTFLPDFNEVAT